MTLLISCACGKKLKVRDELAGKKVKCPGCGNVVTAQPATEAVRAEKPAASPPPKPPPLPAEPVPEDDVEEPPRQELPRRSRDKAKERPREETEAPLWWRCPHNFGQRIVVLTEEAFLFASLKGQALDQAEEDLAEGLEPAAALGKDMAALPYGKLTQISSNKHHTSISANYKDADGDNVSEVFEFSKPKERDRALEALRGWLEPNDWKYTRKNYTTAGATVKPLVAMAIILVITGLLVWLAVWLQTWTGRARIPVWGVFLYHAIMWLGPTGVGIIGGLIALCCVPWLIMRVRKPPIMMTLTPPAPGKAEKEDEDED